MTRTKFRVLHVIKGLNRGGAERLLLSTIRNHDPHFEFEVVYFMRKKSMLVQELTDAGARVACLPVTRLLGWFLVIFRLIRFIRQRKGFDIIHAHLPVPGMVARFAGLFTGVPVVYSEHNLVDRYNAVSQYCSRMTYGLQEKTIAVSTAVAESIMQNYRPGRPVKVIENGVDTEEFNPSRYDRQVLRRQFGIPDRAIVVGVVAVMTVQKRLDRWLDVASHLAGQFPSAFFFIVGDGPLRAELEQRSEALISSGRIRFSGIVTRPAECMACMDVFMLTSDFEGLPVALLEAMSMGCVPVCTPVGGIPSVIVNWQNGFLLKQSFAEEAESVFRKVISDSEERKRIGTGARQTVLTGYSVSRMVAQLEHVYREVSDFNSVNRSGNV